MKSGSGYRFSNRILYPLDDHHFNYTLYPFQWCIDPFNGDSGMLGFDWGVFSLPRPKVDAKKEQRGGQKIDVRQHCLHQPFTNNICFR